MPLYESVEEGSGGQEIPQGVKQELIRRLVPLAQALSRHKFFFFSTDESWR